MDVQRPVALVVDDDFLVRRLAVRALGTRGFECKAVASVAEAREVLHRDKVAVVALDLLMPGEYGYGLALQLLARNPRPVVVVLTGVLLTTAL